MCSFPGVPGACAVWQMIDYVCAPMPFLIGMHISMLPQLKAQPMEEVVMVDLDRGRLRYNEKDIQHLPDEHFDAMVNALQASLEGKTGMPPDPMLPGCVVVQRLPPPAAPAPRCLRALLVRRGRASRH